MDKKKFGQFIKEARLAKKLTQAELAEKLYLDVTAISKWERGVNFPDISMISDICKCLGVTEHELIESSKDTEYRQIVYESRQYKKGRKVAFWSFTGCFLLAILVCFIVNLAVEHTLSWFFIVLTGCACGYWTFFYPILFPMWRKRLPESFNEPLKRASLLVYSGGLLLLTLSILWTSNAFAPFDVLLGVRVTLYCFLILFLYGAVEVLSIHRLTKIGIDALLTGAFSASLAWVLPALMKVKEENYFDIDFRDWAGHSNGNVSCLILVTFAAVGAACILLGHFRKKK